MKKCWEMFPELAEAVRKDHYGKDCSHSYEHAVMTAQYCLLIAEDEGVAHLAAIAALMHNTDRLYPELDERGIEGKVLEYLIAGNLATEMGGCAIQDVINAVLYHSKKNSPGDSSVLICLKDADRLSNLNPFDVIARAAKTYKDLPFVDPRYILEVDPSSTYLAPKTVFRDAIHSSLEWETWFRLPKARLLAKRYLEGLRYCQRLTYQQFAETGMLEFQLL